MSKVRFILADDHSLVRDGLLRILESDSDLECVGVAEDGAEAVKQVKELLPDVAIVDVTMPKMDGIEATKEIKNIAPDTAVLIISAYDYERFVLACIEAGADGYILKTHLPAKGLINSVHMVHNGMKVFDREPSELLCKLATSKGKQGSSRDELGVRELQVLELAAKGMTNKQIGTALSISKQTVGSHFVNIFRKLNVQSRMEAVLYAMKKGWIINVGPDSYHEL